MDRNLKLLEKHPLFEGVKNENMEEILKSLNYNIKNYAKEEYIIRTGSKITSIGILMGGSARIIREDIMGNRMIIADLFHGEIFAETFVCAGIAESPVSVVTTLASQVLWIPLPGIISADKDNARSKRIITGNLLKLLSRKNLYLNRKMEILSKRTIREKLMTYLVFLAEENHASSFVLPLNRNELAEYLCVDRSALSREAMRLKKEGVIDFDKNNFRLIKEI